MQKEKISFTHANGEVEGMYIPVENNVPMVIIVNGHNGFYNYGMFPHIQERLGDNNIASYSFNFSHGGIKAGGDFFEELEKYEKNSMRLEVEDTMCVLNNLNDEKFRKHPKVFLMAHSLGGVPAIFAASKAQTENILIAGIILLSTVKQLNFWPGEMLEEWKQNKIYYKKNNRTNQMLPQGEEFFKMKYSKAILRGVLKMK